jgi:hypothetical protein
MSRHGMGLGLGTIPALSCRHTKTGQAVGSEGRVWRDPNLSPPQEKRGYTDNLFSRILGGMKSCYQCGRTLDLSFFGKNKAKEDGLSHNCRDCMRAYRVSRGRQKPPGWVRKTQDMAEYRRAWKEAHPGYMSQKKREWLQANPDRRRFMDRYKYAVKTGKLVRWPCEVCGEQESDGHHPDYSRPLVVVWLCKQHHREVHS